MGKKKAKPITVEELMEYKIEKAILESGQEKVFVTYSAFDTDIDDNTIDNLNEIAFKGKGAVSCQHLHFDRTYHSPVLENPTWLELTVHCNRMIKELDLRDHIFFEGISELFDFDESGIKSYQFDMGS